LKAIKEKLSVLISGLIITALLISLYIFQPHNFKKIESVVYDTLLTRIDQSEPSGLVTIVDIDEKSLAQVGQWPCLVIK